MEQAIAVAVILLFVGFLLWNGLIRAPLRRSVRAKIENPEGADKELQSLLDELRNGAKTGPILKKVKKRISDEESPSVRAVWLCAAGDVLKRTVSRKATALRYYAKALKADPYSVDARHGMRELLMAQRRGFRLEQVYWRLISTLEFEAHGTQAVIDAWTELAELLERRRSGRYRAQAIRRLLSQISVEDARPDQDDFECRDTEDDE